MVFEIPKMVFEIPKMEFKSCVVDEAMIPSAEYFIETCQARMQRKGVQLPAYCAGLVSYLKRKSIVIMCPFT
jgi:hypothetical protein